MTMWLYQMDQRQWPPGSYCVDIWENERWSWPILRAFKRWNEEKRPQILMYFCQRPAVLNKEELLQS